MATIKARYTQVYGVPVVIKIHASYNRYFMETTFCYPKRSVYAEEEKQTVLKSTNKHKVNNC